MLCLPSEECGSAGDRQCLYSSLNPQPKRDRPVLDTEDVVINKVDKTLDLRALEQH